LSRRGWRPGRAGTATIRALLVRGRANLLQDAAALADIERVRSLFDDLEQKQQLIGLLDNVREAQGVRIFIGCGDAALLALGFRPDRGPLYDRPTSRVVGAIGVIGPARLNYARVIPLVDYTGARSGRLAGAEP
jgi:heat-inducible transcriptional repressor